MTATMKYNLKQITDISYSGFYFEIPEDTFNTINYLCSQVGSSGIVSNLFKKNTPKVPIFENSIDDLSYNALNKNTKKKRGNKSMEVTAEEWESVRTFQTTKIEQKTGIEGDINEIRLYLNKLSDKTFLDMREKIIEKIDSICKISNDKEDLIKLGSMLYELSSTNKFYSKIFADLFSELASIYSWLKDIFNEKYMNIMEQYSNIKYIDSEKDYDGFCEMNKKNERRRAITTFYLNLSLNNFISKESLVKMLKDILISIMNMIITPDKKNEVDELTEIVAILFNKAMIDEVIENEENPEEYYVMGESIVDVVSGLAQKKAKDYPSLSNKAIFKYMDLIEM